MVSIPCHPRNRLLLPANVFDCPQILRKPKHFHLGFFPKQVYLWGSILEKNRLDTLVGALGLVGRGFGPAGRAGLGWAWGLAARRAGWVGRGVGRAGRAGWVGRRVWPCWARWAGWRGVWPLGWAWCWAWGLAVLGALAGLGVVLGVLGALAGFGVVLGVGFGRAGRAGCAGRLRWVGRGVGLLRSLYLAAAMPSTSRLLKAPT